MIGRKMRAKAMADGVELPTYAHEGDAGLDLRITKDVKLAPLQRAIAGTGVAVEIPTGCVGLVFPRSGLAAKHGHAASRYPRVPACRDALRAVRACASR